MERATKNLTGCTVRGLLLLEGQTAMEWALEEITADVTECTVKGLVVANETERTMESVLQ